MRRPILFLAFGIAALALGACADTSSATEPTSIKSAPTTARNDDGCRSGYIDSTGRYVCSDSL